MADGAKLIIGSADTTTTPPSPALITLPPDRRPSSRPSPLGGLVRMLLNFLGLSRIHAGRLNAEDLRVLAILGTAAIVALGGQVDLDAPAPVEIPDALPSVSVSAGAPSAAPAGDGKVDDPTSKGEITVTTAHGLAAIRAEFDPVLRGVSCWDEHAWNPKSDHPKGRACDIYTSPAGEFAAGAGLAQGDRLVAWLRQHADALGVAYVIWQGRIWSPEKGDRAYSGGGVYDATDATGGHFDHIHVSFTS